MNLPRPEILDHTVSSLDTTRDVLGAQPEGTLLVLKHSVWTRGRFDEWSKGGVRTHRTVNSIVMAGVVVSCQDLGHKCALL